MTRVNVAFDVQRLSIKHLLSEHREIKRIPNHLKKHGLKCTIKIPKKFSLGTGHFLFFIDKGEYTLDRYFELYAECKRRGYKVQDYSSSWENSYDKYPQCFNNWVPTEEDRLIIEERINERLK